MKSNKIIKINNRYKNKGITLTGDMKFADLLQSWCYLTRFIFDVVEAKSNFELEDNSEELRIRCKKNFDAMLNQWFYYSIHGGGKR